MLRYGRGTGTHCNAKTSLVARAPKLRTCRIPGILESGVIFTNLVVTYGYVSGIACNSSTSWLLSEVLIVRIVLIVPIVRKSSNQKLHKNLGATFTVARVSRYRTNYCSTRQRCHHTDTPPKHKNR